jgi:hypothetical protein
MGCKGYSFSYDVVLLKITHNFNTDDIPLTLGCKYYLIRISQTVNMEDIII